MFPSTTSGTSPHPIILCGGRPPYSLPCRGPFKNSRIIAPGQNTAELYTFVSLEEPFFVGQRDLLKIGEFALRAVHVHFVTPCSPTSVWEVCLSDRLPSSAVVAFLKPGPAGLVACLRSKIPPSGHFPSHVQERLQSASCILANRRPRLLRYPTSLPPLPSVSFKLFLLSHMRLNCDRANGFMPHERVLVNVNLGKRASPGEV
jgi:hypothetical protein